MSTDGKVASSPIRGGQVRLHSPDLADGGDLPNLPDGPGVYVLVCTFGGRSHHRLGEILYLGASNSLRRRVAYALATPGKSAPHPVQGPLAELQSKGGIARVNFCRLDREGPEKTFETAMIVEYRRRTGRLPKWNTARPSKQAIPLEIRLAAATVLDQLNVREEPG